MVCRNNNCKADFCWTCLGPWEPHGSSWLVSDHDNRSILIPGNIMALAGQYHNRSILVPGNIMALAGQYHNRSILVPGNLMVLAGQYHNRSILVPGNLIALAGQYHYRSIVPQWLSHSQIMVQPDQAEMYQVVTTGCENRTFYLTGPVVLVVGRFQSRLSVEGKCCIINPKPSPNKDSSLSQLSHSRVDFNPV